MAKIKTKAYELKLVIKVHEGFNDDELSDLLWQTYTHAYDNGLDFVLQERREGEKSFKKVYDRAAHDGVLLESIND